MTVHPSKPILALSIGVIGHRPNRLREAILGQVAEDIATVLDALKAETSAARLRYQNIFAAEEPQLTIISALAEGADRMVADAGLSRGFFLDAPLPFPIDVYVHDFESEPARAHYRDLLSNARRVLELPGTCAAKTAAYERVGVTILGISDICKGGEDGKEHRKRQTYWSPDMTPLVGFSKLRQIDPRDIRRSDGVGDIVAHIGLHRLLKI